MDDVFRALLRHLQKVRVVRFIVEFRRLRHRAVAKTVVEIHILRILGKRIEMLLNGPVLFQHKRQRRQFDVVFHHKVMIEIASRIGGKRELIFFHDDPLNDTMFIP